jgi:hypothetical protein
VIILLWKLTIYFDHMPSDLISNIRKKLQDRFTILYSYPIEPIRIKSKRYLHLLMEIKFKIHAVQMKNQMQCHQLKLQWYVNWHKYHLLSG